MTEIELTLCESHSAYRWVGKNHGGNVAVIHFGFWLVLKDSMGKLSARGDSNCPHREKWE